MSSETCTPTNPSNLGWSSSDTLSSRIQTRTTGRFNFHARKLFIFPFLTREPQIAASDIAAEYEGAETSTSLDIQRLAPFSHAFCRKQRRGKTENRVSSSRRVSDILYRRFWHVWRSRTITQIPHRGPLQSQGPTFALLPQVRVRPRQASHIHVSSLPPWILASAVNHP